MGNFKRCLGAGAAARSAGKRPGAKCTEEGSMRRECSRCDHYETETIPAKGYIVGDMNNDGEVNDTDAIYLLRHTLFPDLYPLHY